MNNHPSNHFLTEWGLALVFTGSVLCLVYKGQFVMAGLVVALVVFLTLFRRPDLWWMVVIITTNSQLRLVVNSNKLTTIVMLGFIAVSIAIQGLRVRANIRPFVARTACFMLIFILGIIASQRGWGIRALGSSNWGGMQYILLLSALFFYIYSAHINISENALWKTTQGFFLLSLLPSAAFILVYFVPSMGWLDRIVEISASELEALQYKIGEELVRWQAMEYPSIWMGMLALLLYDRKHKMTKGAFLALGGSLLFLVLSGHRTVVVLLGLTYLVYVAIRFKHIPQSMRMRLVLFVVGALVFVYAFVAHLPLSFQRTVSWLPGIHVATLAEQSASGTSEWRIDLWKEMLHMIPDYLWLGRGVGFNLAEAYSAYTLSSNSQNQYEFFIAVHNYHNGPLWFLIDLGLPGLIAGLLFMFGGIVRYGKRLQAVPDKTLWKTMFVSFYAFFFASCISFFTVIGGSSFLIRILIISSILEVICHSAPVVVKEVSGVQHANQG